MCSNDEAKLDIVSIADAEQQKGTLKLPMISLFPLYRQLHGICSDLLVRRKHLALQWVCRSFQGNICWTKLLLAGNNAEAERNQEPDVALALIRQEAMGGEALIASLLQRCPRGTAIHFLSDKPKTAMHTSFGGENLTQPKGDGGWL